MSARLATTAAMLLLAGCAPSRFAMAPQMALVPVVQACPIRVTPAPAYPDDDTALAAAPDIFRGVQLLMAGRSLRQARERELEAALAICTESNPEGLH